MIFIFSTFVFFAFGVWYGRFGRALIVICLLLQLLGMSKTTSSKRKGECGHWMAAADTHDETCHGCCGCSRENPCFVSGFWGETTWKQVLAKPYAARKAKRGAKTAKGAGSSASTGSYKQTATSRVNSGDVAVSDLSGDPALGAANAVSLLAHSRGLDEKALLANPCQSTQYGGPTGLVTSHTNPGRMLVLETESTDGDLLTQVGQQGLTSTTQVVDLGFSVATPEATTAHFERADIRLPGSSKPRLSSVQNVPGISSDANIDDTELSVGRSVGASDGVGSVGVPSNETEGTHTQLRVASGISLLPPVDLIALAVCSQSTSDVSTITDTQVVGPSVGRSVGRSVGCKVNRRVYNCVLMVTMTVGRSVGW